MSAPISFDHWLQQVAENAEDAMLRESENVIRSFLDLDGSLPSQYGWRFTSSEAFKNQAEALGSAREISRLYWHDVARQIEAYAVMVVWRGSEILRPALSALNGRQILTPAILARSLLELATTAIVHSNKLCKTIDEVLRDPRAAGENTIVAVPELEDYLVKMIFGTRIGNLAQYPRQDRVGTHIRFLSQNPNASELGAVYDYLCDLTHPNMLGNARFWSSVEKSYADRSELVRMERLSESKSTTTIREKILWALGWSSAGLRNSFQMCRDISATILGRWPIEVQDSSRPN